MSAIRVIVGNLHVATTYQEVENEIRQRVARARAKGAEISEDTELQWLAEAVEVHQENRGLYRAVMSGRL